MSSATSTGACQSGIPRIEVLLGQAHEALTAMKLARQRMLQRGLSVDDLPSDDQLLAYAALGDHEREILLNQMRGMPWQQVVDRALATQVTVDAEVTPMLRLLAHLLPHLASIDTLDARLATQDELPVPPQGLVEIRGKTGPCYWGEPLRLQVSASRRVVAMRIHADDALDFAPLLLRSSSVGPTVEHFEVLADEGQIHVTLEDDQGVLYRQSKRIHLAGSAEELW